MSEPRDVDAEWLICAPITARRVIRGSRTARCEVCGAAVWVAPSGQALRRGNPGLHIGCTPCVPLLNADARARGVEPRVAPLTDAQVAEVEAFERGQA
jgi:hypothetical protein